VEEDNSIKDIFTFAGYFPGNNLQGPWLSKNLVKLCCFPSLL